MRCGCGREIVLTAQELESFRAPQKSDLWRVADAMKLLRAKCESETCRTNWRWAEVLVAELGGLDVERVRKEYGDYLEWLNGR